MTQFFTSQLDTRCTIQPKNKKLNELNYETLFFNVFEIYRHKNLLNLT